MPAIGHWAFIAFIEDLALALDPDTVSTACPYCLVMLGDAEKAAGEAKPSLEVIDVAQLLVRSVRGATTETQATAGADSPDRSDN